jgi:hypothetical protein
VPMLGDTARRSLLATRWRSPTCPRWEADGSYWTPCALGPLSWGVPARGWLAGTADRGGQRAVAALPRLQHPRGTVVCSGSLGSSIPGAVCTRPWRARQTSPNAAAATTTETTYPSFDAGPCLTHRHLAGGAAHRGPGPHAVLLRCGKGGVSLGVRRIVVRCP